MVKLIFGFATLVVLAFLAYGYYFQFTTQKGYNNSVFVNKASNMILTSSAFINGGSIPKKYTCEGINVNPPLNITTVSIFAKSLTLIMDDPDSPSKDFTHWIVFNIDPKTTLIDENSNLNGAKEGLNDFGQPHYGGPCPSTGEHLYQFTLYALDSNLSLDKGATKQQVLNAMKGHILEQTRLTGKYKLSQ